MYSLFRPPVCIDIMKAVKGLNFDSAYQHSAFVEVDNLFVRLIDYRDLIKSKKASGRAKDINDIENLVNKEKE